MVEWTSTTPPVLTSVSVVGHELFKHNIQESVSLCESYGNPRLMGRHSIPKKKVVTSTNVHSHVIVFTRLSLFSMCLCAEFHQLVGEPGNEATCMFIVESGMCSLINPRRMRSEGYSSRSVCLSVCLFVCLSATVLALQATRRLMSDTNRFSATRAGKITWRFC